MKKYNDPITATNTAKLNISDENNLIDLIREWFSRLIRKINRKKSNISLFIPPRIENPKNIESIKKEIIRLYN
ncbi:hypothetical protein KAJ27_10045 [bacterium]|nr:hypothetical protein [bacterium]